MPFGRGIDAAGLAKRKPALAFGIGLGVLLIGLFADPLFVSRTFADRDLVPFFLPIEKAVHESWRQAQPPLWMPEISFGRPLAANPNAGAFYPPRIAMAALPFAFAFKFFPLLHLWLSGIGAFLLARLLGASPAGSALSGVTYALCGPALSEIAYPNVLPGLAAMPFLIWAAGRYGQNPSRRAAALCGFLWGLELLIGDVFTAGLALLGAFLLAAQEVPPGRRGKTLAGLFLSLTPGFLLAGIQLIPAILFTPLTIRAMGRFPLRHSLKWSVPLPRLIELFVPFPFGNSALDRLVWGETLWSGKSAGFFNTLYAGAFASCSFAWYRLRRGKRLFPYALAAISAALAAAGYYLPASLLESASPLPLRYPEKLMVGVALVLAVVSGLALDELRRGTGGRRASRTAAAVALALSVAAAAVSGFPAGVERLVNRSWSKIFLAGGIAAQNLAAILWSAAAKWSLLAALLVLLTLRRSRVRLLFAMLFVLIDLDSVRRAFIFTQPESLVLSTPPAARAVRQITRPPSFGFFPMQEYLAPSSAPLSFNRPFRLAMDEARATLGSDAGAAFGISYIFNGDYDLSDFYRVELMRRQIGREAGRWPGLPGFLGAFSARAAIVTAGLQPQAFPRPARVILPEWIVLNPQALPSVRFAGEVREVRDAGEAFALINSGEVDLSRVTVVETGRNARLSLPGGHIRVLRWEPARVEIETDADGPGRLLLVRSYFPFRRVEIDAAAVDTAPADFCLTSLAVPSGRHRVTLREELPGRASGPVLTLCGAVFLIYRCRRRGKDESS